MELNQHLAIVAMARLCGVEGEPKEIIERFMAEYKKAVEESEKARPAKVEVFRRPF